MTALTAEQSAAIERARERRLAREQGRDTYSGTILPFSRDESGDVRFDPNAGIVGPVWRAINAPGEALRGELPVMDGAGNVTDEAIGRSLEFGSVFSPVNPAVRAGDRAIPGFARERRRQPSIEPPSSDELRSVAQQQYRQMQTLPADYPAQGHRAALQRIVQQLGEEGFNIETSPGVIRSFERAINSPEGAVFGPREIQTMRIGVGQLRRPSVAHPSQRAAASRALQLLDEYIQAAPRTPSTPANQAAQRQVASMLDEANQNWAAASRGREVASIGEDARLSAAAANSGQNVGNAIRQGVRGALRSPRAFRGYTDEELSVLRRIVEGTIAQNATRRGANLLGGGQGMSASQTGGWGGLAGAAVGSTVGAPLQGAVIGAGLPVIVGGALKTTTNNLTQRALREADRLVRTRSPLYRQMLQQVPAEGRSPAQRIALIRALMASELARFYMEQEDTPTAPRVLD